MRRTILGLFLDPADEDITTTKLGHGDAVHVEEVQEDLSGIPVYSGTAAYEGSKTVDAPVVNDDGTIDETERTIDDPRTTNWFAVPDANPGFAAVDASDGDYAFDQLSSITGGWIEDAGYNLYAFTDYLESQNAQIWQVVWSDSDEAGTWYPDESGSPTGAITRRGLENHPKQVGFRYSYEGDLLRGTIAESGYCELYWPDGWEAPEMAQFVREELLQFAAIPDIGPAEDIASGDVGISDLDTEEDESGPEADQNDAQAQLGETASESVPDECEECGREPERGFEQVDGEHLCIVCADAREEDSVETGFENLDSVTVTGGESDE
jgi:hypothetical protein